MRKKYNTPFDVSVSSRKQVMRAVERAMNRYLENKISRQVLVEVLECLNSIDTAIVSDRRLSPVERDKVLEW